jgi:hypothetical protein
LIGKPKGKGGVRSLRHRWEDIIRMDLREIVWEVLDWMNLAQNRDQWLAFVKQ